jgi:hypothetical protein
LLEKFRKSAEIVDKSMEQFMKKAITTFFLIKIDHKNNDISKEEIV